MIWLIAVMYVWAGFTTAYALWQMEEIGESLNGLLDSMGSDNMRMKRNLRGRPWVWVVVIVIWPAVAPMWVAMWHRHNVEVRGASRLYGEASLRTTGCAAKPTE